MPKLTILPHDFNQHPGIYLTALLLAVIAITYLVVISPILQKPIAVSSYEECIKRSDSVIQESYPAVCVTSDKQRFTQPIEQSSPSAQPGN